MTKTFPTKTLILLLGLFLFSAVSSRAQDTNKPVYDVENPLLSRPQRFKVMGIKISGTENYNPEFIAASTGIQEGDEVTIPGDDIPNAIKALHRTGLFSDVQVFENQRVGNTIFLEFYVREQPRLEEYKIKGVKRSQRRDLKERITLLPGFAVTQSSRMQAVNVIRAFYEEKGYRNTAVDIKTVKTDSVRNRVTLELHIDKGDRYQVKNIDFEFKLALDEELKPVYKRKILWPFAKKKTGEHLIADKKLEKLIKPLKANKWWRLGKQTYNEEKLDEGLQKITDYFLEQGHRDFRIVSDTNYVIEYRKGLFKRRKNALNVDIVLQPGPKYFIRNIEWEGNTVYTKEQLTQSLDFQKGDVLDEKRFDANLYFNETSSDVTSLYNNAGYLFFNVQPEFDVEGDSVDVTFFITEDEKATIREVIFKGNSITHDNVVRRSLRTVPGDFFSRAAIQRSVRELSTLGFFVPENIRPNVVNVDFQNKTTDVIYELDESLSTNNFELSGGFGGAGIGLILAARINITNFSVQNIAKRDTWGRRVPLPTGDAQRLSLGVQVTGRGFQTYDISFTEPWLLGRPNSFGVGLSYSLFDRGSIRNELFSARVSLGRRLTWPDDFFTHTTGLTFQSFNVNDPQLVANGIANLLILRQTLERNSFDNFISPNRGSKLTLSGELGLPLFSSLSQFYKIKFGYQHHLPLVGKLILTSSYENGYIGWLSFGRRSQFQRFQLGGTPLVQRQSIITENIDLKGFPGGARNSIAPFDPAIGLRGGTIYNKYSTELRIAAVQNESIQLIPYTFAEAGNAYINFERFDPFEVKRSAGFGMRLFLPILGLIDLSYGYRFDGVAGTNVEAGDWEFLFNIGAPF